MLYIYCVRPNSMLKKYAILFFKRFGPTYTYIRTHTHILLVQTIAQNAHVGKWTACACVCARSPHACRHANHRTQSPFEYVQHRRTHTCTLTQDHHRPENMLTRLRGADATQGASAMQMRSVSPMTTSTVRDSGSCMICVHRGAECN